MLGKGGMGEVYRATDLSLGQPVALKFLPEALCAHPAMIARFYGEVRTARRVSHPNVCRVYDIGEIEGSHYISMEYVDGEDLGSLLRRIGRLPMDKAHEIARKLCAGLAAAHNQGILHRDLKPANVMLDSQGHVYIMDFGLAGLAAEIEGAEIRNGTPAYMSPEQLAGTEVTVRSDIYALGLLLYEVYTGKRPFPAKSLAELIRLQQEPPAHRASEIVPGLDPAVERTLDRCLHPDPAVRPGSALLVSASLPGGNPLAEALAAGETPSPELVAASGSVEGMRPLFAVLCLGAILIGTLLTAWLVSIAYAPVLAPLELPPEVLANKAREMAEKLGYSERLPGSVDGFDWNAPLADHLRTLQEPLPPAARGPDQAFTFWLRESPNPILMNLAETQNITWAKPAFDLAGMRRIRLDPHGDLLEFEAIPQRNTMEMRAEPPDWEDILRIAGFNPGAFSEAPPTWTPTQPFDARIAWTGSCPNFQPDLRIEAAAWKGTLVWFRVIPKWEKPQATTASDSGMLQVGIQIFFFVGILGAAAALAWHNVRSKKGDRRGARRTAIGAMILGVSSWLLSVRHAVSPEELVLVDSGVEISMLFAATLWIMYLAIEPYLRRHLPQTLVTWTRVLAGNFRDSLVASDVLLGTVVGIAWAAIYAIRLIVLSRMNLPFQPRLDTETLLGARFAVASVIGFPLATIRQLFFLLVVFFICRLALRRSGVAAVATVILFAILNTFGSPTPLVDLPYALVSVGLFVFLLIRMGILCAFTAFYMSWVLTFLPLTLDLNVWYSSTSLVALATVAVTGVWAFRTTLAGRPLLTSKLDPGW